MTSRPTARRLATLGVVVALLFIAARAGAEPLTGRLTDPFTGTPVPGADVRVLGTDRSTTTGPDGRWSFDLPPGTYELAVEKTLGAKTHRIRVVNQRVPQYKPGRGHLYTTYYAEQSSNRLGPGWGRPTPRLHGPTHSDRGTVDLTRPHDGTTDGANQIGLPADVPSQIRVARRKAPENGCTNNPIVAIEQMSLAEYARGVLPPEIGVFRSLTDVEAVYRSFALAAKSYALWFVLYYDSNRRRTVGSPKPPHGHTWFHIDDTACNQRYSDTRLSITDRAAADVEGKILAKADAPDELDKYEYAASCGRHGTRPEYQRAIVPDAPPTNACVNSWCGHDDCAGHADHPDKPGQDRCLVRGICQWGAASWAEAGKDYKWLIDHYQPNLTIRDRPDGPDGETVVLTGYVHRDPDAIADSGIPDARVTLEPGGAKAQTDADGLYRFESVPLSAGTVDIEAAKSGFEMNRRQKELVAGTTNWASIRLEPASGQNSDTGATPPDIGLDAAVEDTATTSRDASLDRDDTAVSSDASPRRDAAPPQNASPGGLGSILGPSSGPPSGCSCRTTGPRPRPTVWALLVVGCGLLIGRRRR